MTQPSATTRPGASVLVTAVALGVDMFLYGAVVPLLPSLPAVNGSPVISGALFAVYAAALLACTPFVGVWVGRVGPRRPLLTGLLGVAAATLLFASATGVRGTTGVVMLVAARAAQGMAAAASWTAGLALVAAVYPAERRGRAMGLALSAVGAGILFGPAISGWLATAFGLRAPFLLIAVLAAGDAIARITLIKRTGAPPAPVPFRAVLRGPRVALLVALTALGAATIAFLEPVLPLRLDTLGVGTAGIGLVFAGATLAGVVGSPLGGMFSDRVGATRIASIGAAATALGFVLAGQDSTVWAITGVVVVGFGAQLILAPTLVLIGVLAESTQPPAYGVAYALYNVAYTGGLAIAPLIAGVTAGLANVMTATLVAAVLAAALAVTMALRRPEADGLVSSGAARAGHHQS